MVMKANPRPRLPPQKKRGEISSGAFLKEPLDQNQASVFFALAVFLHCAFS
jgi:hypothetical protein